MNTRKCNYCLDCLHFCCLLLDKLPEWIDSRGRITNFLLKKAEKYSTVYDTIVNKGMENEE